MSKKLLGAIIIVVLGLGLLAVLMGVQQSTENRQHASSIFEDINSGGDIRETNNADGTMGPSTWLGNFSNTLPDAYLGSLDFGVTDPEQGRRPTEGITITVPESPKPTHGEPSPTKGNEDKEPSTTPIENGPQGVDKQGGPQAVSLLAITVWKVEVHLAHLAIPGEKLTITPEISKEKVSGTQGDLSEKISMVPEQHDNRSVDKWETLNIGSSKTIDLVSLGKTHTIDSLGITKLANGHYTEIRLYIATASATLVDGTKIPLSIPGRANIVRVVEPFIVNTGKTTTFSMDFDAQNSVIQVGSTYILKPVVIRLNQKYQK